MYYKLQAADNRSLNGAYWDAETSGLDPTVYTGSLTFDLGTGNIEKVSRIIKKHNLKVLVESDYAPNELAYLYERN